MAVVKQKIVPHLWFDREAKEAAHFYCTVFPDSSITSINTLHKTPSGDCDVVSFTLSGQPFMAISAGPLFKFNELGFLHGLIASTRRNRLFFAVPQAGTVRLAQAGVWILMEDRARVSQKK